MLSLLVHAALGVITTAFAFWLNAHLYQGRWRGRGVTALEAAYYVLSVASVLIGWYFNVTYVFAYPTEASWVHYTKLLFTNPAACSGFQDYIFANVFFFPMWVVSDGRRRGLKFPFIFFVMSLFTSFGFAMGMYLAAQERQVRWSAAQPAGGADAGDDA